MGDTFAQQASPSQSPSPGNRQTDDSLSRVTVYGQAFESELPVLDATTATRIPQAILDTDRSVSVINRQTLEDRAIDDPQEAIKDSAGVVESGAFNGFGEDYLIRGFLQQDVFKDGFRAGHASNIGFSATGPTDVANLGRIEILRGPAGLLYGRGEPGGIVNYITRIPFFGNTASLTQQFGSYDFYRTELDANWSAMAAKLALRLDAAYDTKNSFIDFVYGEREFVAPSLLWQITPQTTFIFRGEYSHDLGLNNPGLPYVDGHVLPGVPYSRYLGEPDFANYHINTFRGLLTLEHKWTDNVVTTLSFHGRHSDNDTHYVNIANFNGEPTVDPVTGLVSRESVIGATHVENQDVRLDQLFTWTIYDGGAVAAVTSKEKKVVPLGTGFPTVKNQLLISGEYERENDRTHSIFNALPPLNAFHPVYTGYDPMPLAVGLPLNLPEDLDTTGGSYSLLALDRLSFGDTVFFSLGGRIVQFDANQKDVLAPQVFGPGTNVDTSQLTFNPSAGALVKPSHNSSLYFSYAESTNSFNNLSAITADRGTVDPERSHAFEMGAKMEFLQGRLFATADVFQITKENVVAPDPHDPIFSVNAGKERSRGFECEINGTPIPGWRLSLAYTYTDARIISAPEDLNVGHRFFGVPYNSGGFFSTYEFQNGLLKGFGLGAGETVSGNVQVTNEDTGRLAGWAETDLVAFYRRGNFRVQINVKNLFDNEYYYARNDLFTVQPAQARTIIGTVSVQF